MSRISTAPRPAVASALLLGAVEPVIAAAASAARPAPVEAGARKTASRAFPELVAAGRSFFSSG
jgi:hypothetical protein